MLRTLAALGVLRGAVAVSGESDARLIAAVSAFVNIGL